MKLYDESDLTQAYLDGKSGKPLTIPAGVDMVEVTSLNGVEYENLYIQRQNTGATR